MELIQSVGDCVPSLIGVAKSIMAGGANGHEAINLIRQSLDQIAAYPERYLPPRQPLPPGYQDEIDRVYGACCGEDGDLEARGS
jgi:hypothetical protein